MTRRIISVALIVLGLVAVLAAIATATIWRPTDTATLSLPSRPDAPVVITEPGVLDAVGSEVTVRATADDDQPVTLAVGRTADVEAWVGDAPHQRVTGLASWEQLEVSDEAGAGSDAEATPDDEATPGDEATSDEEAEQTLPDPSGSDLWVAEQTGTGSAELRWSETEGRWSLLAATDGAAPAPQVSLTWPVEVRTPWLVPGIVVGAALIILGVVLLVLQSLSGRRRDERAATVAARADETAVLTAVGAEETTREHGRHSSRRRSRFARPAPDTPSTTRTDDVGTRDVDEAGIARGTGIVPASPRAAELRADRDPERVAADEAAQDGTAPAETAHGAGADGRTAGERSAATDEVTSAPPQAGPASGWRALWGFGPSEDEPTGDARDEGKEQR